MNHRRWYSLDGFRGTSEGNAVGAPSSKCWHFQNHSCQSRCCSLENWSCSSLLSVPNAVGYGGSHPFLIHGGNPQLSSTYSKIFHEIDINKPSSYWGIPMTMETPYISKKKSWPQLPSGEHPASPSWTKVSAASPSAKQTFPAPWLEISWKSCWIFGAGVGFWRHKPKAWPSSLKIQLVCYPNLVAIQHA